MGCASGLALGLALAASPALSQERLYEFNIAPQPMSGALKEYADVADRTLVFTDALVAGLRTDGLRGRYEPGAALARLLAGSGLTSRRTAAGALMIVREDRADPQPAAAAGTDPPAAAELTTLVVVGSRLKGETEGPAPVTILDDAFIDRLGATGLSDVLDYLPQQTFSLTENFTTAGQQNVQLRGLSLGTTLVLINGRRTVPGANSVVQGAFDLNAIPLSAVERVEVLAGSASAVYGADAVGGVVNVVLKSSTPRPVLDVYYGAADGGAAEKRAALALGGEGERLRGALALDYFKRDYLYGRERALTNDADYRPFGGTDRRVLTANPGNICAASGNLPTLGTPCAAVPTGSTGLGLRPADFLATAGQQNFATRSRYASIVPAARRYSLVANGEWDLTGQVTAFGELIASERRDTAVNAPPVVSNGLVPAANPFNPFGVPVRANFLLTGVRNVSASKETWYSAAVGLRGRWRAWDWELTALGSQSDSHRETRGNVDAARVTAALAATDPALALNVFQDGPGGSPALLGALLADPSLNALDNTADALQLGGFVRGPLFSLPAGDVQAVLGGEWRDEELSSSSPGQAFFVRASDAQRKITSAYGELGVPLISEAMSAPFAQALKLTLAGRFDHYSDFGSTFNAQVGAEWRPARDLLVRGSYGESYRAPSLYQLWRPVFLGQPTQAVDPRRGNETVFVTTQTGGNPDLAPETSDALNVGVVWTPEVTGRPRVIVNYWRIKQDQRIISAFNIPTVLANEAFLPGRARRADPTPQDIAAGRPGRLLHVDLSLLNQGELETSGLDLELGGALDTPHGTVQATVTATRVLTYDSQDFLTSPVTDRVGIANTNGTIPKWKAVASLSWKVEAFTLSGAVRYVSGYDDAASTNLANGLKVASSTRVDLQLAADLAAVLPGADLARGLTARVGVMNLFDEAPHHSANLSSGYDPYLADLRQRFVYVALSKEF